jgi:hypothetical protein
MTAPVDVLERRVRSRLPPPERVSNEPRAAGEEKTHRSEEMPITASESRTVRATKFTESRMHRSFALPVFRQVGRQTFVVKAIQHFLSEDDVSVFHAPRRQKAITGQLSRDPDQYFPQVPTGYQMGEAVSCRREPVKDAIYDGGDAVLGNEGKVAIEFSPAANKNAVHADLTYQDLSEVDRERAGRRNREQCDKTTIACRLDRLV